LEILKQRPLTVLSRCVNREVYIHLKNNLGYKGFLTKADMQMNLILENAVEYNNGKPAASLGKVFIRGNNILYIQIEPNII